MVSGTIAIETMHIEPLPGDPLRLLILGQPGRSLTLQGSPDLFFWTNLGRFSNANGTLAITSAPPAGQSAYFYRTLLLEGTNALAPLPP